MSAMDQVAILVKGEHRCENKNVPMEAKFWLSTGNRLIFKKGRSGWVLCQEPVCGDAGNLSSAGMQGACLRGSRLRTFLQGWP